MMKIAVVMAKATGILLYRAAQRPKIAHGSTPGARKCLPEESRDPTPRLARCRICAYKSLAGLIFLPRLLCSGDAEAGRLGLLGHPEKLGRHVVGLGMLGYPDKLRRHVVGLGVLRGPDKLGRHIIGLGLLRDPDKLGRHVIGLSVLRDPDKLGRHVVGLAEAGRGRGALMFRGGVKRSRDEQNCRR